MGEFDELRPFPHLLEEDTHPVIFKSDHLAGSRKGFLVNDHYQYFLKTMPLVPANGFWQKEA